MNRASLHICAAALAFEAALIFVVILACGQPQSVESTTPAAPVACAKDTDCKGERICVQGRCVQPH